MAISLRQSGIKLSVVPVDADTLDPIVVSDYKHTGAIRRLLPVDDIVNKGYDGILIFLRFRGTAELSEKLPEVQSQIIDILSIPVERL